MFLFFLYKNDNFINPFIRCSHYFNCHDPNKTVHFKFDRFDTEKDYDALIIGDPNASKSIQWSEECCWNVLNANCSIEEALIIHGSEVTTNIWIEAKGITDFHIFFFRTVVQKCIFSSINSF